MIRYFLNVYKNLLKDTRHEYKILKDTSNNPEHE